MLSLVLAGVAVSSFAGALTALALNLAPSPFAALEIAFWLLGSLADRSLADVYHRRAADGARLGAGAHHRPRARRAHAGRGFGARRSASISAGCGSLSCSASRSRSAPRCRSSGAIGFVGLVVPHILRPFVGHEPGRLLLPSALGGAVLVLAADLVVRLISTGIELKLGVVTALVGAPFFLSLVLSTRRAMR